MPFFSSYNKNQIKFSKSEIQIQISKWISIYIQFSVRNDGGGEITKDNRVPMQFHASSPSYRYLLYDNGITTTLYLAINYFTELSTSGTLGILIRKIQLEKNNFFCCQVLCSCKSTKCPRSWQLCEVISSKLWITLNIFTYFQISIRLINLFIRLNKKLIESNHVQCNYSSCLPLWLVVPIVPTSIIRNICNKFHSLSSYHSWQHELLIRVVFTFLKNFV